MNYIKMLTLTTCFFAACATQAPAQKIGGKTAVTGINWLLTEVRSPEKNLKLDRSKLQIADAYSFRIEENKTADSPKTDPRAYGTGFPNRWNGQCSFNDSGKVSLGNIASTKMASFIEPELKEDEFFKILQKVSAWSLVESDRLELSTGGSRPSVLIFTKGK